MRSQAVASCLLGFSFCAAFGQSSGELVPAPVQAEFLKHVHVRNLAAGSTLFARVTVDWAGPHCVLRRGAILEATVEGAELRHGHDNSTLALSFTRAQCNAAESSPMNLVLVAIAEAPLDYSVASNIEFRIPSTLSGGVPGQSGISDSPVATIQSPRVQFSGILHRFPMKSQVHNGDVIGIRGMKLEVGTGPNRGSVLSSARTDVSLSAFTQLLLVPASVLFVAASSAPSPALPQAADNPEPKPPPPPPPANTLDICAPPGCAVDLPVAARELVGASSGSIAARPLGYFRPSEKILGDFDNDQTLAWLGPNELLFAFNPRQLIRRANGDAGTVRMIRAVLLDASARTIIRAVDWEIRDTQQYLWQVNENRILVHVGDELRVYRSGLEVERTIPLSGPLAFLRTSPNGELIALATVRERHSLELHARLRDETVLEPEEDVDILILDKTFNTVASGTTVSTLMPPTLLNEGQVKLLAQPSAGYRLAIDTWQNTTATLARFESLCTPQLSSLAPDLLFLVACNLRTRGTDYRVIGGDGKLLLRGSSGPLQVAFEATGNAHAFALKFVTAVREITPTGFSPLDLESAEVRVYRARDGKRLLAVRISEPATSRGAFALSPESSQLAVLSGTEIKLFSVPQP